jgi:hypothetical protein
MAHKTDRDIARRNLRLAQLRLTRASIRADRLRVEWPGEITPAWDRYTAVQNRVVGNAQIVDNLTALLDIESPPTWSCRRVGFDATGSLVLDGDWIVDGAGGDELCMACASAALLAGDMAPDSVMAYLLYVGDPDYSVICADCGTELYHVDNEDEQD